MTTTFQRVINLPTGFVAIRPIFENGQAKSASLREINPARPRIYTERLLQDCYEARYALQNLSVEEAYSDEQWANIPRFDSVELNVPSPQNFAPQTRALIAEKLGLNETDLKLSSIESKLILGG